MSSFEQSLGLRDRVRGLGNEACHDLGFELLSEKFGLGVFYEKSTKNIFPEAFVLTLPETLFLIILLSRAAPRLFEAARNLCRAGDRELLFETLAHDIESRLMPTNDSKLVSAAIRSFFDDYESSEIYANAKSRCLGMTFFFHGEPLSQTKVSASSMSHGVVVPVMASRPKKFRTIRAS